MTIEQHRLEWHGRADAITILTFMPRFPARVQMHRAGGSWTADIHIPADGRIEYRFEIRRGHRIETTLDPANGEIASNPFGMNSVLAGSEYRSAERCETQWDLREFRVVSAAFGGRRHHHLLSPPGVDDRQALPLVMLHDGSDYWEHAGIEKVLTCAIDAGAIPAVRIALLEPRHRNTEYAADPRQAAHVMTEVLPRLQDRLGSDGRVVLGGASLGAVAAWHAAWSYPGQVTGLLLQSGTFAMGAHPEIPPAMATSLESFISVAVDDPRVRDIGVGQTCGRYESLIDWNRSVAGAFASHARLHRFEERWTGHDWAAWADTFVGALAIALEPSASGLVAE